MRTLTLFNAYTRAVSMCDTYLHHRGTNSGIACEKDHLALCWQRYARLAHKLGLRIRCRLGEPLPTDPINSFTYYYTETGKPCVKHFDAWKPTLHDFLDRGQIEYLLSAPNGKVYYGKR